MRVLPLVGTAWPRRPLEKSYSAFIFLPLLRGWPSPGIRRSPSSRSVQTATNNSPSALSPDRNPASLAFRGIIVDRQAQRIVQDAFPPDKRKPVLGNYALIREIP